MPLAIDDFIEDQRKGYIKDEVGEGWKWRLGITAKTERAICQAKRRKFKAFWNGSHKTKTYCNGDDIQENLEFHFGDGLERISIEKFA
jgi:hypothetical protein